MATEAEACRRPTQSQTTTGSLPVNTEQASEVDLKKPLTGEETVDRPSLHDIPTAGATFGTKSNEDAPEDRLVGEQYGQNTTPFEQQKQNQGIDAHQDKTKQAPDLETLTHTIDGLAGEMDVPQDQAELERELLYDVFSATKHLRRPLSDRVSSGKRRVVQTMSYMQLVEDRLLFLETKMDKINQHIRSLTGQPPEETEKSKKDAQASRQLILEVNRISIAEDQARKKTAVQEVDRSRARARRNESDSVHPSTYEGKLWTRHIIDVVVPEMGSGNSFTTPLSLSANVKPNSADPANPEPGENQRQSPSRVRIHSTLLLDLLKHISDDQFVTHERAGQCHQTFLQPFKLFVTYEVEIRKWAEKLEEKLNDESLPSETNGAGEKWTKKEITKPQKLDKPQNDASENPVIAQNPTSSDLSKGESATASHLDPLWTRECLDHLKVLIQLFDNDLKPVFDHHRDAISGKLRSIAFAELWHLFGSGEDIQSANGHPQVCRVLTSAGGRPFLSTKRDAGMARDEEESSIITSNGSPFIIQAFCYDFDGSAIGAVERTFTIQRYEGKRLITSLPCYPVRFAKTARDLAQYRQELMDRGRRFAQLATDNQKIHYRYSGLTLDEVSQPKEQISSDVIIDFTMAFLANKEWELKIGIGPQLPPDPRETLEVIDAEDTQFEGINETVHKDYNIDSQRLKSFLEKEKPNLGSSISVQDLKADDFLLFPNRVLGFVLRSRKWASFAVANIEDIIQQDAGFDQLILPEGHRDTLLALVQTHAQAVRPTQEDMLHTSKQTDELDLVRGKGKGLIILLHGEPGVGKTSTAESIAAYTDRPLFAVTCGDIGQTAEDVESRLETNFQLAHRWGCVLLLDEAE
ncbi:hypothetical protein H2200_011278 [Cladophialophora chaetospira]|uniref:AAA+ ATPase domain-containing protein n=1 Tax=Cladophialophora chaetospira TaxID=386627 RepID=A0AA38X0G3_9EURO|nr:hypothetical protein H2200_011278 [Cladophialophora chaetospira]